MTVLNDISSALTTSWVQNSVIWIIISGIIGGILTQVFKFVFEQSIPQWQRKRATRIAIQKYRGPISQSGWRLLTSIKDILNNPEILNDENLRISILYDFGCFFGWIEILLNESFVEGLETPDRLKSYGKMARYQYHLSLLLFNIIYHISNYLHYKENIAFKMKTPMITSHWPLDAIGQLMIDKPEEKSSHSYSKVIDIVKFIQNYERSDDFKKLFREIDNILSGLRKSKLNPKWNLLIRLQVDILLFGYNVEKKSEIIPPEWIPSMAKLIISKISWMPGKIRKYLRLIQLLVNTHRTDLSSFKLTVEMLTNRGQFAKERLRDDDKFTVRKPERIVIYNKDDLKYNAIHIPKRYPNSLKFYLEHGKNKLIKLNIAETLSPYLERHYLRDDIISDLKLTLEQAGYLPMINRPYDDHLLYLNKLLDKEPKNAKAWNNKAILCICHLGTSRSKMDSSEAVGYLQAIDCYDKAIELDSDYFEAWNNKGVAYMEKDKYGDKIYDYQRAKEFFETAIKCFDKALENDKKNRVYSLSKKGSADIYNNLGVCYYELQDYDEAIKCFDKALEIDNFFNLAEDNAAITLKKVNNKR
jgi:tetratricopeptide (TPR) repeat protein